MKFLFDLGTINITDIIAKTTTIDADMKYGLANLWKEIPDDKIAVISVLLAILEVNHITARKRKTGYN